MCYKDGHDTHIVNQLKERYIPIAETQFWPKTILINRYNLMLNKTPWAQQKCEANQKQHCKQADTTLKLNIEKLKPTFFNF